MGLLEDFAYWLVTGLLGVPAGRTADVLAYFIYDSVKVLILLAVMVFLVSVVRTFITPEKVRKWLGGR